jgi:Zn-dependent membrane protease YugP
MYFVVFGLLILGIVFLPGVWVQHVLSRYAEPADRYSGTGSQLARHLLNKYDMEHVKVEETNEGDHYDPNDKAVRLTADKFRPAAQP